MKIAVKDANIMIDLLEADLLGHWFKLEIETHTTDLVLNEISRPPQRVIVNQFVSAGMLDVHVTSAIEMQSVAVLADTWRMSIPDASVVELARRFDASLLSGDGAVRKAAAALEVEVRGALWILDTLVERTVITPAIAHKSLTLLMKGSCFLPRSDCADRLKRWC